MRYVMLGILLMVHGLAANGLVYEQPPKELAQFKKGLQRKQQELHEEIKTLRKKERELEELKQRQEEALRRFQQQEEWQHEVLQAKKLEEDDEREELKEELQGRRTKKRQHVQVQKEKEKKEAAQRKIAKEKDEKESKRVQAAKKLIYELREFFDGYIRRELVAYRVAPQRIKELVDDTLQDVLDVASTSVRSINFVIDTVNERVAEISTLLPSKNLVNHVYAMERYRAVEKQ